MDNGKQLLSTKEVREKLGIDDSSITNYVKEGLPHQKIKGQNFFVEREVIQWRARTHPKQKITGADKASVILRKETARAEILELQLAENLKQVVITDTIIEEIVERITRTKTKLLGIPVKFRSILETNNIPLEIIDLLKDELDNIIRETLTELKDGKF